MGIDFTLYRRGTYENGEEFRTTVFTTGTTHNLTTMASHAGIYEAIWRPDEHGYEKAGDIIPLLEQGLKRLKEDKEYFEQFNPPNGWGTYEGFVSFVEELLNNCKEYPNTYIDIWR